MQKLTLEEKIAIYNKNKYKNFVASSKLEGIDLPSTPPEKTLKDIIEKYKNKEPL